MCVEGQCGYETNCTAFWLVISDVCSLLGSTSCKKNVLFRALPEKGGTPARIFWPFFHHVLSLISWHQYHVMWYFLVIFNTKIVKSTKIMITIITPIIVVIIVTWFCNMRKNIVFDVQKKLYNLPELGGGGGR